jgi:hypothetical protein
MANSGKFGTAKPILIFNQRRKLTLMASSILEAARFSKIEATQISRACSGNLMSTKSFYFRYISPEVELAFSDFGQLKLEEYDQLCGVVRPIYATSKMNRKNWKYNKSKNTES